MILAAALVGGAIYSAIAFATVEVLLKETEHADFGATLPMGIFWPITIATFFFRKLFTWIYKKVK